MASNLKSLQPKSDGLQPTNLNSTQDLCTLFPSVPVPPSTNCGMVGLLSVVATEDYE